MNNESKYRDRDTGRSSAILPEILSLCASTWPKIDLSALKDSYRYVTDFFRGKNSNFEKNILPYHNLRHTRIVTLATARLFHGLHHRGVEIRAAAVEKGLLSALFHDTGMLELRIETHPFINKLKATTTHETRSAQLMRTYISVIGLPLFYSIECEEIINHTNLNIKPDSIECSNESKLIGQVIGSADIIAQMADRYYLESLSYLFHEMEKANNSQYETVQEMMRNTTSFYELMKDRLENQLGNIYHALREHFKRTRGIDRNIYLDQINANIEYLNKIIKQCDSEGVQISHFLRRVPPVLENNPPPHPFSQNE